MPPRSKPMARASTKLRKCKHCKQSFVPARPNAVVCSPDCGLSLVRSNREKRALKLDRIAAKNDRARKEALKTRADWIADVQVEFNRFIRARDIGAGHGCIDCGKQFEPSRPGGSVDAGHYLSRGSAPHLRFNENNCFAQRKNCNRPGGATREAFRTGVEARIGLAALEALERDQTVQKWTIDELKAMKAEYKAKTKKLLENRRERV
jgi:hypothetical protein